jgi:hypothetical protein
VLQIEMCWIRWSAGVEKLGGGYWWSGDAVYYVLHLDDLGYHLPIPAAVRASPIVFRPLTWSALAIELFAPFLLWFRETRRAALVAIVALHIGIEYMMNLVLFEWVMLVGWIAHGQPADLAWLRDRGRAFARRVRSHAVRQQRHARRGL